MEKQFQFSLDHALEFILIFNLQGRILYANQSARQELAYADDLCNHNIEEVIPNLLQEMDFVSKADVTAADDLLEGTVYRENRTCLPVRMKILPLEGESEDTYICYIYNMSKVQFLENKLAQADEETQTLLKLKSEFVANVTHELRTPVNGILGNANELVGLETAPEKLRLLRLMERGCQDMNAIINNILDFSKLEAGKFTLEKREFNLRELLDYVKSNHINKITEKGLEFFWTISPEVPETVIGDELRIAQILNNLLSNATKFTSAGKIMVEVVKTQQFERRVELFFMVIDSGIGISQEEQDRLFQSFSQVDASISRKYGGTGLGLNICKQLVELMDGNIRVESERGKGSMFSFHIWVDVPEGENSTDVNTDMDEVMRKLRELSQERDVQKIFTYGEEENKEEIRKKMSKLVLCMEMENWEKAEGFADSIKQLTEGAPKEIKTKALRLKMAVQKEDYEKAMDAFNKLQQDL
jgi:signal transduction histidine kinase